MRFAALHDGCIMRVIIVVAAGLGLAGCSSFSMPDAFKSAPPSTTLQLESLPIGAEARTSAGQSCKTPCSLSVPAADNFSVTFSLPKYQSETVQVQVQRQTPEYAAPDSQSPSIAPVLIEPNPVYAELQPAQPSKKGKAAPKTAAAPKAKRPKASVAPADGSSPFPPPPAR